MQPVIQLQSVNKIFIIPHEQRDTLKESFLNIWKKRTYEKFRALDDISLTIQKGDFVGIVGKNGSGKSTLLKILARIYQPNNGTVKVVGEVAPFLELGIGFQPELTARENIFVNGSLLGLTRHQIQTKFKKIIEFAEIENFLDLKIKNFSSGMRARLAFAIAKEADSDIYLCDEVLAVGDEQFQKKCLEVFSEWKREGKTIVFVSHNSSLIQTFCTKAVLLDKGKVISIDIPANIINQYHELLKI